MMQYTSASKLINQELSISVTYFPSYFVPHQCDSKNNEAQDDKGSSVLALATLQGTVLVYSPEKRKLLATLDHSQPQAVVDVAWCGPNVLFTLSADNTVAKWNVVTGKKVL